MRDVLVFAIVLFLLPTSIRRPFVGMLLFSWLAYMRPQDLCWGFARSMRMSFFVGVAMFLGWWAYEQGRRRFARWDVRTSLMATLGFVVTLSYALAQHQNEYTNQYFVEFLKIIAIALFTTGQVDTRERLRMLLWTIAISLGFFGVKNGVLGILGGGAPILRGPGGMLEDNNDFALALVMNVPLLWYLGRQDGRQWVVRATQAAALLSVVTIVLTHSRGAFLALTVTSLWMAWRSGQLFRAAAGLAAAGVAFLLLAPESVLERLASIGDTKESSANARLTAWATALRMIGDNPLLGVGLRNFQPRYAEYSVVPLPPDATTYVAHNSYLQIWAESGTIAFVVYLLLLGSVFVACARIRLAARLQPQLGWAGDYARMMEATTAGFLVGAFFLNRGHFDLIYHWIALVTSLTVIVAGQARAAPAAQRSGFARGVVVNWSRARSAFARAGQSAALAARWR
jgi:probable O-glycosylation ligase (exosortase A-associated)